jgi:hypothetical protein
VSDICAPPTVTVVQTAFASDRTTRVESVTLDSNGLSISVSSQLWDARVRFEQTYGFRVLDELDLTEFWSHCTLEDGWLFEVTSGGWKELELTRPHFHSGRQDWVREYLVVGLNECVSVLTKEEPSVLAAAPSNPSLQPTAFGGG